MTKIFVREGIPADLDLGTVRPGTYELVKCMGRGESRNSVPEPAYMLDGITVSEKRVNDYIAINLAEIINEVKPEGVKMTNLPAIAESEVMSIERLKSQVNLIQQVMKEVMHKDEHYGIIPGCKKPSLLKPGAEKISLTFRLAPYYEITEKEMPNLHREYIMKCTLKHIETGKTFAEGVGSCSTMEAKYRYRTGPGETTGVQVPKAYWDSRKSDAAFAMSTLKALANADGFEGNKFGTKKDDTGTWYITTASEKIEHDNPADYYNTVLKMAKKRAHVDAVLTATAASDIFTQDVEDMVPENGHKTPEATPEAPKTPPPASKAETSAPSPSKDAPSDAATEKQRGKLFMMAKERWGGDATKAKAFMEWLKKMAGAEYFTKKYASECIEDFDARAGDFDNDLVSKGNDEFPM
jgi:hypothetical protein